MVRLGGRPRPLPAAAPNPACAAPHCAARPAPRGTGHRGGGRPQTTPIAACRPPRPTSRNPRGA
eukprot:3371246-Lingulodinium_polyedra.AAC.1